MSDAILFYRLGWQAIWKQKIIFLYYAAFLFAIQFSPYVNYIQDNFLWLRCLLTPFSLLVIPVSLIAGSIGEVFISYKITQSEHLLFDDIFQLIKKHFWRFTKLFVLIGFIGALFWISGSLLQYRIKGFGIEPFIFLFAFVNTLFTGFWLFAFTKFLIKDHGVFKSISGAWKLFCKNLPALMAMGIICYGMWYIPNLIVVVIFEVIRSNFSLTAFSAINFLAPGILLQENLAYLLMIYIISIFSQALANTSFMYAYHQYSQIEKYSDKKIPG